MSDYYLKVGSTVLPAPTKMDISNELIWSSNAGRNSNGEMIGDVVAKKKTLEVEWTNLTRGEADGMIEDISGDSPFRTYTYKVGNGKEHEIRAYRGTITRSGLTEVKGGFYYKSVTVNIIEK